MMEEDEKQSEVGTRGTNTVPSSATKQKSIRITLEGAEYLAFHELVGRLVFTRRMTERQTDEEVVKTGLRVLFAQVGERTRDGETFVDVGSLRV
ncbi:MAG: hypothetical protein HZB71_05395 [Betaproteobacteria bacterium]|nr:hypothetical protein [Betaproteobacteria bacterium]